MWASAMRQGYCTSQHVVQPLDRGLRDKELGQAPSISGHVRCEYGL